MAISIQEIAQAILEGNAAFALFESFDGVDMHTSTLGNLVARDAL